MKKLVTTTVSALGLLIASTASSYAAIATLTSVGDSYTASSPVDGLFNDFFEFGIASGSGLSVSLSGDYQDFLLTGLLITNTANPSQQWSFPCTPGSAFSITCDASFGPTSPVHLADGNYQLSLAGVGTGENAAYSLTVSAVPLPAAAWLFGSAVLGAVAWNRRKRLSGTGLPA